MSVKKFARALLSPKARGKIRQDYRNRNFVNQLIREGRPIRLELGAGGRRMDGWISVDLHPESDIQRDLKRKLPFPDNSVDHICSSHVLEHFYHDDLIKLINDCRRVLKPGGLFRAAVPNARIYIEGYIDPTEFDKEKYCKYKPAYHYYSDIDLVNFIAYMDGHHKYMFDEENIVKILQECNFNSVQRKEFDPNIDLNKRKHGSIYVECVK